MSDRVLMVCGSRTLRGLFWHIAPMLDAFSSRTPVIRLVVGDEPHGPDDAARRWAMSRKIEFKVYQADWNLGLKAGPLRNKQMVEQGRATDCIAFWDGRSRGTLDTIKRAVEAGIPVTIVSERYLREEQMKSATA